MRLLVINPNTSAAITDLLHRCVQQAAGPAVDVRAVTAPFGAAYIADEATYAVAAHAALEAWAAASAAGTGAQAVLIGCFGDPGLFALREVSGLPVTGLAEASFVEARRHGRFVIVTGGHRWPAMLQRLAAQLGYAEALIGVHAIEATGADIAANPEAARGALLQACRAAARTPGAQAVVLGGAGLAGMAADLQPDVPLPLIDSVAAGTRHALSLAAGG